MNERIKELAEQAITEKLSLDEFIVALKKEPHDFYGFRRCELEKFAELIVRKCINKIETYRTPVGNSAAGEMACEWTYDALKEIRDGIKEDFGVE